jgi:hypothetical protein
VVDAAVIAALKIKVLNMAGSCGGMVSTAMLGPFWLRVGALANTPPRQQVAM